MPISEPVDVFAPDLLKGQVAFVTGGGTGIGREIARVLGRHGARVAIASRRREICEETAAELRHEGIEVLVDQFDVRKPDQVERVVRAILERWGRLDILVNNAAGNFPAPISKISYNGFKSVVDIDLLGTYNCSKAAFELAMRENGVNPGATGNTEGMKRSLRSTRRDTLDHTLDHTSSDIYRGGFLRGAAKWPEEQSHAFVLRLLLQLPRIAVRQRVRSRRVVINPRLLNQ